MPRKSISYHVAPRYTSGSPALVDEETAHTVARQEEDGYARAKSGVYGDADVVKAHALGLDGVAYMTMEKGKNILLTDLCTGLGYTVPVKDWQGNRWHARDDRARFLTRD